MFFASCLKLFYSSVSFVNYFCKLNFYDSNSKIVSAFPYLPDLDNMIVADPRL